MANSHIMETRTLATSYVNLEDYINARVGWNRRADGTNHTQATASPFIKFTGNQTFKGPITTVTIVG